MSQNKEEKEFLDFFKGTEGDDFSALLSLLDAVEKDEVADKVAEVEKTVVPVRKWLTSSYYLGSWAQDLYPFWREEVADFCEGGYDEWIITGALGTGKSSAALVAANRKLYELTCYDHPQHVYQLSKLTKIVFAYFSVSLQQAALTGFSQLRDMLDDIPYYKKEFKRDTRVNTILRFPKRLYITPGSDALHVIGTNMFGAVLDEANFLRAGGGAEGSLKKAYDLYINLTERRVSRFKSLKTEVPGFSIIVASANNQSSFTESRIKNAGKRTKITVARLWDVKHRGTYSEKKFFVFAGTDLIDPKILETQEDLYEAIPEAFREIVYDNTVDCVNLSQCVPRLPDGLRNRVIDIPEDFRTEFEKDIHSALRSIAGIATAPAGKLFTSRALYNLCYTPDMAHPFTSDTMVVSTEEGTPEILELLKKDVLFRELPNGRWELKHHPEKRRFVHIDQSETGDCSGIGIVHNAGFIIDQISGESLPIVQIDLMLRIFPPSKPHQISITKMARFIFKLREMGMSFGKVTYDQYQSSQSIQNFNSRGIKSEKRSMDKDDTFYKDFVSLIYDRRLRTYRYIPCEEELFDLDHDRDNHKVDHPHGGRKDVIDAVAGAVANCLESVKSGERPISDVYEGSSGILQRLHRERQGEDFSWVVGGMKLHPRIKAQINSEVRRVM